ncbi:metal ABC transporter ATP-binding protein [Calothrix sp. UHCC 0171]|uniref:metal ABC transporter ATP-binding protein n=1 Tax=Calothrix sp. UHCC 0171 TaxID=3110245 RepID=UPI002B21DCBC|nr:metal ABC transporter ATP-binding protein [Calothrix sp. UHCC 0171]MEA5573634.1 metal ABC transporter ATP-binding protein [Calothrix sp. UHCC 0171]
MEANLGSQNRRNYLQSREIPAQSVAKNLEIESVLGINITDISVYYRTQAALGNISCNVKPGRLTGIYGPNGAGKSTLMKAMLGLVPASGKVIYQTKLLSAQLEKVAYVPQRSQIDWSYPATVWDVVMMGRVKKTGWLRQFSTVSRKVAKDALARVGMSEFMHRPIGQLSGGQQQRVFLARALTQEAEIFCFDEPFVGIDQKTQSVIFEIFHELADEGKIVLVVNHDLGESINHFDDLILLNQELIAAGSRQDVLTEDNLYRAYSGRVMYFGNAA